MGQRVERGGQAARAHLRGAGTGADLIHVEEGVSCTRLFLKNETKYAGDNVLKLV